MTFKLHTTEVVEVDLLSIPYLNWPDAAKQAAWDIMHTPGRAKLFLGQLPLLRKDLLVKLIEEEQKLQEDFDNWWFNGKEHHGNPSI
jgi:hypothetical protein